MITVFTPSFADESDTNAQNLTVKEVVARLSPERFRVGMFHEDVPDARIVARPNTTLLKWRKHGNTPRMLVHFLAHVPDVYFFPREGPLDAAVLSVRKHLRLRTAVVTYIVSGGLDRNEMRPTMARNIREADAVVGNNTYLCGTLQRRLGFDVKTIYDGIDRRYYYPPGNQGEREGPLVVFYAGSFRPYKRVHLVVEQAARWPRVEFRIAGQGEEEERCRKLARQLGCTNVSFLGHLSQPELGEEMRKADVFFFPSEVEGHPQVLGQAAACGLPCVAMESYHPDFVRDGQTGFLARSDEELAEKLGLLLTHPELRCSMSSAAVVHTQQFDWDRVTKCWQDVFEDVVKRKRQIRV